jgi:hypothetical protein
MTITTNKIAVDFVIIYNPKRLQMYATNILKE